MPENQLEILMCVKKLRDFCNEHQWRVAGDNFQTNRCFGCVFCVPATELNPQQICVINVPPIWQTTPTMNSIWEQIPVTEPIFFQKQEITEQEEDANATQEKTPEITQDTITEILEGEVLS